MEPDHGLAQRVPRGPFTERILIDTKPIGIHKRGERVMKRRSGPIKSCGDLATARSTVGDRFEDRPIERSVMKRRILSDHGAAFVHERRRSRQQVVVPEGLEHRLHSTRNQNCYAESPSHFAEE